jgi:hypothetical protein
LNCEFKAIACPFQKSLGRFFENFFVDLHLLSRLLIDDRESRSRKSCS